jgi:hypothetical protein
MQENCIDQNPVEMVSCKGSNSSEVPPFQTRNRPRLQNLTCFSLSPIILLLKTQEVKPLVSPNFPKSNQNLTSNSSALCYLRTRRSCCAQRLLCSRSSGVAEPANCLSRVEPQSWVALARSLAILSDCRKDLRRLGRLLQMFFKKYEGRATSSELSGVISSKA